MVAQRHQRRARRDGTSRSDGEVRRAPDPRHVRSLEFCADQSRAPEAHRRERRPQSVRRLSAHARGLGTHGQWKEAGRQRGLRSRTAGRGQPGQGRVPQSTDRVDPVCAGDGRGSARAGADRAGLDHEILHPRPVGAEFPGEISHQPGLHRIHDLMEESVGCRPRPRHGGLPPAGCDGGARRDCGNRARAADPRHGLLPGRHFARDRCGGHGPRWRRAPEDRHAAGGADGLQRGRRIDAFHRRESRSPSSRT